MAELKNPAWTEQKNQTGNSLESILQSKIFKTAGLEQTQIDANLLILFGLLQCQGALEDKTRLLYNLVQPGGTSKHPYIAAEDKDFNMMFGKMCDFATKDIIFIMLNVQQD